MVKKEIEFNTGGSTFVTGKPDKCAANMAKLRRELVPRDLTNKIEEIELEDLADNSFLYVDNGDEAHIGKKINAKDALSGHVEEQIAEHNASEIAHPFIQGKIVEETTRAETAEAVLQVNINNEATTRANADISEATARIDADNVISQNLNIEIDNRIAGDVSTLNAAKADATVKDDAVKAWANDRFITDERLSEEYAKKVYVQQQDELVKEWVNETKQDKLISGTRIIIDSEGVISTSASEVSVDSEGTSITKVKYITINGTEYLMGTDDPTEYTTKLEDDLYTYAPIGVITGASQTNPVKVADAGDPLKDVFNAILGTEQDVNPTIDTTGTTFTKSAQTGTTEESGGEVGKTINAQTGTVTFNVTNTATCSYGLKAGDNDTYNKKVSTTYVYPIKTRTVTIDDITYNYQMAISYPSLNGCTLSVTLGTLVKDDTVNKILYCNVDNDKNVKVSISIPAGNSTTSAQTRFDQMTANIEYNAPQYNNVNVDNFWTYLKASYTAQGMTPPTQKTAKSTAYTITAGVYYPYYIQSANPTIGETLSGATKTTDAKAYTDGAEYTISNNYFMFVIPNAKTYNKIQQYITGQWNNMETTSLGTTTLTLDTGATATYKVFRTDALVLASKLKLRINS